MSQLAPRTESFGAGDQSWLGSRHGTDVAKTATLNPSAWSAKTSDGRIKSGEPFAVVSDLAVPYNSAGSNGTDVISGFILTDQSVTGSANVSFPAVWTGRILRSKLPSTVPADAKTAGLFVLEA
ncbi:potassium transporter [Gordonia alkanivorans]|uniref:potassium transporter n=1 Tax=Gordonia alkanivorans TaxID=84096 RepID=UPI0024B67C64|nr:potassium transporter [Gordonia alkanivorans]MDJ0010104.1 potassium transporter [Gordonia alkanivorans]MDJ0495706.1 potassium transporter [Gordonia alkanivorans]